jgi:hypothetical protein
MTRSSYLRSLAGPLPGSASLLRPPRVSPWARPRDMEAFGKETNSKQSAAEAIPEVTPRTPVESHPALGQDFYERESTLARGPQAVAAPVRRLPAAVPAEPLQVINPIRPNRRDHTGDNASAESTMRDVAIAPRPSQPKTEVSATVTDSVRSVRSNPAVASPATQDVSLPLKSAGLPLATAPDKDARKVPQEWKGRLWANDEELLQAGNPRRPPIPRIPLLPVNEVQPPAAKVEDERKSNSVHIGRVEIHVTPPPPPVARQQPARVAVGGGVLSRGFTSPFGFNQG